MTLASALAGRPKRYITVDASTNSFAFALWDEGKLIKFGKITFKGVDTFVRAHDAYRKVHQFCLKHKVEAIVVESAIFANSPKTAMQLSFVQSGVCVGAQEAGISMIRTATPIQWQNHIGNRLLTAAEKNAIIKQYPGKSKSWYKDKNREIRKGRTITYVNKRFGIDLSDDDVADAIGVGCYVSDRWKEFFA